MRNTYQTKIIKIAKPAEWTLGRINAALQCGHIAKATWLDRRRGTCECQDCQAGRPQNPVARFLAADLVAA